MNAESIRTLSAVIDDLTKAHDKVESLKDVLGKTPLASERNALAAKIDAAKKDVTPFIRKVEAAAKGRP